PPRSTVSPYTTLFRSLLGLTVRGFFGVEVHVPLLRLGARRALPLRSLLEPEQALDGLLELGFRSRLDRLELNVLRRNLDGVDIDVGAKLHGLVLEHVV